MKREIIGVHSDNPVTFIMSRGQNPGVLDLIEFKKIEGRFEVREIIPDGDDTIFNVMPMIS